MRELFRVTSDKKLIYNKAADLIFGETNFPKGFVVIPKEVAGNDITNYAVTLIFTITVVDEGTGVVPIELLLVDMGGYFISQEIEIDDNIIRGVGQINANIKFENETEVGYTPSVVIPILDKLTNSSAEVTPSYEGESTDVQINGISIVADSIANILVDGEYSQDNVIATLTSIGNELMPIQSQIDAISTRLTTAEQIIVGIQSLIPLQASIENQLADKEFTNSSVATNTAYFKGTYESEEDLPMEDVTNNDYAFVDTVDEEGNRVFNRYKYNSNTEQWAYEYTLNNSSFTAEQWATINSGVTQEQLNAILQSLQGKADDSNVVHKTGNEEINGEKTFKPYTNLSTTYFQFSASYDFGPYIIFSSQKTTGGFFYLYNDRIKYRGYNFYYPNRNENDTIATLKDIDEKIAAITDYEEQQF